MGPVTIGARPWYVPLAFEAATVSLRPVVEFSLWNFRNESRFSDLHICGKVEDSKLNALECWRIVFLRLLCSRGNIFLIGHSCHRRRF
jgi:hypothetical protein